MCHSLGGGTGSGMGTLLISKIREEYPGEAAALNLPHHSVQQQSTYLVCVGPSACAVPPALQHMMLAGLSATLGRYALVQPALHDPNTVLVIWLPSDRLNLLPCRPDDDDLQRGALPQGV